MGGGVEGLPPDGVPRVDAAALRERLSAIPDAWNVTLRLVDGKRTTSEVVAGSDLGEADAIRVMIRLAAEGVLLGPGSDDLRARANATAPPEAVSWFEPPGERSVASEQHPTPVPSGSVRPRPVPPHESAPAGLRGARVAAAALVVASAAIVAAAGWARWNPGPERARAPAEVPAPVPVPVADVPAPAPAPDAGAVAADPAAERPPAAEPPAAAEPERSPARPESRPPGPATPVRPVAPPKPRQARAAAAVAPSPEEIARRESERQRALASGVRNLGQGAHAAAVVDFRSALGLRETAEGWFGLAQALAESGRAEEARDAFRRCADLEPGSAWAGEAGRALRRLR